MFNLKKKREKPRSHHEGAANNEIRGAPFYRKILVLNSKPEGDFEIVHEYDITPPSSFRAGNSVARIHICRKNAVGFYFVDEPPISESAKISLEKAIASMLFFTKPTNILKDNLTAFIERQLDELGASLEKIDKDEADALRYYISREFIGYSVLDPLIRDPFVEDISCEGVRRPVRVWHKLLNEYDWLETNLRFDSAEELDSITSMLTYKAGKPLSIFQPIADLMLPEGHRLSATWQNEVSSFGSSFTIRKFREEPYTITELVNMKMLNPQIAAFIWQLLELRGFVMIVGVSASGKTSFINSLAAILPPTWKIVTIEDVREIKLPHKGWKALHTRQGGAVKEGRITLFQLLKLSLRERPDFLILGEARGAEAQVLFQAAATGHGCLTSFHASDIESLVMRLSQPPISIPAGLIPAIDLIVFLVRGTLEDRARRRVQEIYEHDGKEWSCLYRFQVNGWKGDYINSRSLRRRVRGFGIEFDEILREISRKEMFLNEMRSRGIFRFEELSKHIEEFYIDRRGAL